MVEEFDWSVEMAVNSFAQVRPPGIPPSTVVSKLPVPVMLYASLKNICKSDCMNF
jgi:hypothetical protein